MAYFTKIINGTLIFIGIDGAEGEILSGGLALGEDVEER
jgi:hypothetical protein